MVRLDYLFLVVARRKHGRNRFTRSSESNNQEGKEYESSQHRRTGSVLAIVILADNEIPSYSAGPDTPSVWIWYRATLTLPFIATVTL
jgi:hypothetical protein